MKYIFNTIIIIELYNIRSSHKKLILTDIASYDTAGILLWWPKRIFTLMRIDSGIVSA